MVVSPPPLASPSPPTPPSPPPPPPHPPPPPQTNPPPPPPPPPPPSPPPPTSPSPPPPQENKPDIPISSPDYSFILLINHLLHTLLFALPRGFFAYHPDAAAHAKLHSLGGGDVIAERFTKSVYLEFHKVVEEKPGGLFSVRDSEGGGRAAWGGLGAGKEGGRGGGEGEGG